MRKIVYGVAVLTLALSPSLLWAAADQPSAAQPQGMTDNSAATSPGTPATGAPQSTTPPANWTSLQGTVQAVDPAAKIVKIQDTTGATLEVPVNRQVRIEKDGVQMKLSEIKAGDTIILAKKDTPDQEKPKAY
jgi:hypothetical protein